MVTLEPSVQGGADHNSLGFPLHGGLAHHISWYKLLAYKLGSKGVAPASNATEDAINMVARWASKCKVPDP